MCTFLGTKAKNIFCRPGAGNQPLQKPQKLVYYPYAKRLKIDDKVSES